MARIRAIVTRCRRCQADSTHLRTRGGWQVRITVLPDEKHYATSPCAQCGEWHFRALDIDEIRMMRDRYGVLVEDLLLINPGLERDTMPDPTADELCHMFWIAYEATPETRQAVIQSAVDKILGRPEHPAAGA